MTTAFPFKRLTLVVVTVTLFTLTSCSTTTKPSAGKPTTTPHDSGTHAQIDWARCKSGDMSFECGTLEVPVDYDDPNGAKLKLALVREKASNIADRVGPLLVNPGGPGASGIDFVEGNYWSPQIRSHFDLIGFDPRGVGQSSPLECNDNLGEMYSADPAPRTPEATAKLLSLSKAFVDACAEKYGDLLPHLGTRNIARDMDQIRLALGEKKISYLGYSYGTSIGQVYADLFPTHIRAMVLDGVVKLGQPGLAAARDQGIAFEKSLNDFFDECKYKSYCQLQPNPDEYFDRVQDAVRQAPIPIPGSTESLTPGMFQLGAAQAMYSDQLWGDLQHGLNEATKGNGGPMLDLADQYLDRLPDGTYNHGFEIYFAVSCLDWSWPSDPKAYLAAGRAMDAKAPRMGEAIVTDYVRCAYWPTPPQPLTPPKAKGSPTIVVVSTTDDPATPYRNGVGLAKRLPKGVLITKVGSTHTAYGQRDSCINGPVDAYLISLQKPKPGIRCP